MDVDVNGRFGLIQRFFAYVYVRVGFFGFRWLARWKLLGRASH